MLRFPIIAKEGWLVLIIATGLALLWQLSLNNLWALPAWLGVGFLAWLFRDPVHPITPIIPFAILSPINGHIKSINRIEHPELGKDALHIQISRSWFDVMSIFSPVSGKPMSGCVKIALNGQLKNKKLNFSMHLKTDEDADIHLSFVTRHPLSHFFCNAHIGEHLGQGQRCGFSYWACKVDIYLPEYARPHLKEGMQVKAGRSCVADLRRSINLHSYNATEI